MGSIKSLLWASLIVVAAYLGVGYCADRKTVVECRNPSWVEMVPGQQAAESRKPKQVEKVVDQPVDGRNPNLVEMVIDQPKEYPGFFYPVCDEDDPDFFRKVRLAVNDCYTGRVMTVVEIKVKGLNTPIQSWTISLPLPLAYDATELEFRMMATDKLVLKKLYVLQHNRLVLCPKKEWRKRGLSVSGSGSYKMKVSANHTDHIRGWLIVFDSSVPYPVDPNSGMTVPHSHQLAVMQLPKMDVVTLEDIKKYAAEFTAACRRTFERYD